MLLGAFYFIGSESDCMWMKRIPLTFSEGIENIKTARASFSLSHCRVCIFIYWQKIFILGVQKRESHTLKFLAEEKN